MPPPPKSALPRPCSNSQMEETTRAGRKAPKPPPPSKAESSSPLSSPASSPETPPGWPSDPDSDPAEDTIVVRGYYDNAGRRYDLSDVPAGLQDEDSASDDDDEDSDDDKKSDDDKDSDEDEKSDDDEESDDKNDGDDKGSGDADNSSDDDDDADAQQNTGNATQVNETECDKADRQDVSKNDAADDTAEKQLPGNKNVNDNGSRQEDSDDEPMADDVSFVSDKKVPVKKPTANENAARQGKTRVADKQVNTSASQAQPHRPYRARWWRSPKKSSRPGSSPDSVSSYDCVQEAAKPLIIKRADHNDKVCPPPTTTPKPNVALGTKKNEGLRIPEQRDLTLAVPILSQHDVHTTPFDVVRKNMTREESFATTFSVAYTDDGFYFAQGSAESAYKAIHVTNTLYRHLHGADAPSLQVFVRPTPRLGDELYSKPPVSAGAAAASVGAGKAKLPTRSVNKRSHGVAFSDGDGSDGAEKDGDGHDHNISSSVVISISSDSE
ncbi:hypothetical protein B0H63DRAFT_556217 [Podospora didyma]|uniref:Uncharacterized protein n=1 Tax=Podospora didyma TaxID=330526 RepID=A0AAE0U8W7_9PEZI|nr:hypothetical protein B0H63DRAFT_556217 [Podospora didyma]